jgi:hypothetical protein
MNKVQSETHTWCVLKAAGGVWHAVILPVHDAASERQRGMPDVAASKTGCGLAVSAGVLVASERRGQPG